KPAPVTGRGLHGGKGLSNRRIIHRGRNHARLFQPAQASSKVAAETWGWAGQSSASQPTRKRPARRTARGGSVPQKGQAKGVGDATGRPAPSAPWAMACHMFMVEDYKTACIKSTRGLACSPVYRTR